MPNHPISPQYQSHDFHWPIRIYWEDTDAGGIVFYANYLKYFERARTEWLRQLGFHQEKMRQEYGGMFVVASVNMQYLAPARLDDMLHVSAHIHDMRRTQLTLHQTAWKISLENPPQALCQGDIQLAWVSAQHMRPTKMPADLLTAMAAKNPSIH